MIDLHTHSCFSDGSDTPQELIQKAIDIQLEAIALTDHDTVDGCPHFQEEASKHQNIIAINGCEFTIDHPKNIEIIALNIKNLSPYFERQKMLKEYRNEVAQQRIYKLQNLGFKISFEDILYDEIGQKRTQLAKPHIVNFLHKTKQIPDTKTGYKKLLNKGCPAYVKAKAPTAKDTIDFIRQTGAVSILAHPCLIELKGEDLFNEIKELKKYGLQGIEVMHSDMTEDEMTFYHHIADELNLLKSGGSDFHGENAHYGVKLGVGRGQVNLPCQYLNDIISASNNL